ncbi:HAD family phosphatase, partial [Tritonibacter sp. SIMBA_163]
MTTFAGLAMPEVAASATQMGATLPQDWIDEGYGEAYQTLRDGGPLIPGVMEVIARLDHEGIPCCVVS